MYLGPSLHLIFEGHFLHNNHPRRFLSLRFLPFRGARHRPRRRRARRQGPRPDPTPWIDIRLSHVGGVEMSGRVCVVVLVRALFDDAYMLLGYRLIAVAQLCARVLWVRSNRGLRY